LAELVGPLVHLQASAEVDKVVAVDIAVVDAVALVDPLVMEMAADDSLVMAVEVEPWATVSVDVAVEFPPTDWADEVQAMAIRCPSSLKQHGLLTHLKFENKLRAFRPQCF